jgi:hypothetical protein
LPKAVCDQSKDRLSLSISLFPIKICAAVSCMNKALETKDFA